MSERQRRPALGGVHGVHDVDVPFAFGNGDPGWATCDLTDRLIRIWDTTVRDVADPHPRIPPHLEQAAQRTLRARPAR